MGDYSHAFRKYFSFRQPELLDVLITAAAGGLIFGFLRQQSGDDFQLGMAVSRFLLNTIAILILVGIQVLAYKAAGIFFGVHVDYEKYILGLLIGVFVSVLSLGIIPLLITGRLYYSSIENLRIGKFRAKFPKNWEIGLIAASGGLATILLTIPLNILSLITDAAFFGDVIRLAVLLSIFSLLPLPLIQTTNPYTVYMSRLEALEGGLPGFDLFYASRGWFFFFFGMTICFGVLALLFDPSLLVLTLSILLGFGTMFVYIKAREHFA